jgi:hypothetical protein
MSSIMQYNGAAVICMAGKKCVGIASDKRYGLQNQTVACDMRKTFKLNDKTLVGLTGLATDMQTLEQKFVFRSNVSGCRPSKRPQLQRAPQGAPAPSAATADTTPQFSKLIWPSLLLAPDTRAGAGTAHTTALSRASSCCARMLRARAAATTHRPPAPS